MKEIPLTFGNYKDYSTDVSNQELINCFRIKDALYPMPGCKTWADAGSGEVRGLKKVRGLGYAVIGNKFYTTTAAGGLTEKGSLSSFSSIVQMESNGVNIMIVEPGIAGHIYTIADGTLAKITDADFPIPSSLTYQDGFYVVTEKDSDRHYKSAAYGGAAWNALEFSTAAASADYAVAAYSLHRELIIFGTETAEPYWNEGVATYPFTRREEATMHTSLAGPNDICDLDNTIFWRDNDNEINRLDNYVPMVLTEPAITYQMGLASGTSHMYAFTFEGYPFVVVTKGNQTWVFNIKTGLWNRWKSYGSGRHRSNCYMKCYNKHLVGDYENGKIYELDWDTYTDNGKTIERVFTLPKITSKLMPPEHPDDKMVFHHKLRIGFEAGVGTDTGSGTDPQAILELSDNGKTWGNKYWRPIGKIGEYDREVTWPMLGAAKRRDYRITVYDPVKVVVSEAYLDATVGV